MIYNLFSGLLALFLFLFLFELRDGLSVQAGLLAVIAAFLLWRAYDAWKRDTLRRKVARKESPERDAEGET